MKLLVIGGGGREHAIAWKLAQSERVEKVFVVPGNPGIALEPKIEVRPIPANHFPQIEALVKSENIGFVVVGPDQALADGIVDFLEAKKIYTFGPTQAAARLEFSKAFAKEVMAAVNIPTARFQVFTDLAKAEKFLHSEAWGQGWVVKADGLALGKGVVVCESKEEALHTVRDFFDGAMGNAGKKILLEERMYGPELSAFSLCDGEKAVFLGFACDYKRLLDGGMGPNTGGMGAYSPADWMPKDLAETIQKKVVLPLLGEMAKRGAPYKGILFTGLMITQDGPRVLEFNARFGDPETQVILPMLEEDLLPWLMAARRGALSELSSAGPKLKSGTAVHVVMAARGYPGLNGEVVRKGDTIEIAEEKDANTKLFFAGVSGEGKKLLTNGGRVLGITALDADRESARKKAYKALEKVHFSGAQKRGDIGA